MRKRPAPILTTSARSTSLEAGGTVAKGAKAGTMARLRQIMAGGTKLAEAERMLTAGDLEGAYAAAGRAHRANVPGAFELMGKIEAKAAATGGGTSRRKRSR